MAEMWAPSAKRCKLSTSIGLGFSPLSVMDTINEDEGYDDLRQVIREGIHRTYHAGGLSTLKVPMIHFTYYCPTPFPYENLIPAEFAIAQCSLNKGLEEVQGSLIDPGSDCCPVDVSEILQRKDELHVPRPGYTLKNGLAYSVGEDRFEEILRVIKENVFVHRINGWKAVFTLSEHIPAVNGCLKWLSAKCDDHLGIGVFPLEIIFCEFMRTCRMSKLCEERGVTELPSDDDEEFQAIRNAEPLEGSKVALRNTFWNNRLRLGCHWHQRAEICDGLSKCPQLHVKKWAYIFVHRGLKILERDFEPFIKEMRGEDMYPTVYKIIDAESIEARQRLGLFGKISNARRAVLEDGFIFPNMLEALKKRFPQGFSKQPKEIIWPVDREIEKDLNYVPGNSFIVKDPDPVGRSAKKELKMKRDAEKARQAADNEW